MVKQYFESRKEKILELVIENYINTASPASSRAISRRLRRALSSATIRNVMADLEDAGLITHPHTSAGRTPTDKGYRFYVNKLMQAKLLTEDEKGRIDKEFKQRFKEVDDILLNTSRLLSSIAGEASLVALPAFERGTFEHIELVEINKNRVLVILVTKSGLVKNITVKFDKPLKKGDINKIVNFLNTRYSGVSLYDIRKIITRQLLAERNSFYYIINETKKIIDLLINNATDEKIYLEGASRIITQPEFRNLEKIEVLLKSLEDPSVLSSIVKKSYNTDGIDIYIGEEVEIDGLCDCSLVIGNYGIKNNTSGVLAIIGPKRMPYSKIVSLVDYVSKSLSEILE